MIDDNAGTISVEYTTTTSPMTPKRYVGDPATTLNITKDRNNCAATNSRQLTAVHADVPYGNDANPKDIDVVASANNPATRFLWTD